MVVSRATQLGSGIQRMEARWGVLLALPAILGFLMFTAGPMLASLAFSVTDWTIGVPAHFVKLDNFVTLLSKDPLFYQSLTVTLIYTGLSVPLLLLVAFLAALLLNQRIRGRAFFRTVFYLPTLMPTVANAILWLWMFNPDFGLLNSGLKALGLPSSQWIFDSRTAVASLILMGAWGFGGATVIFLAGLQSVPRHLYEAVEVDGGAPWHKLRYVTLPMMTPTIFFNLVLGLIGAFQVFAPAQIMTNGGPGNATLFYVFYLYRVAFNEGRMGYASALAWLLFVVVLLVTIAVFRWGRSWVYYEGEAAA